ncbi:DMT family transporter [Thermodesulfobacteriota bacterium]
MTKSRESNGSARKGYFYVILAAVLWAISGSSAKFLFNHGISPFQLVQLRITIAAVFLFLWLIIRFPSLLKIARRDILYFMIFGIVGMAAVQFTYLYAISKINVAAAILLQYLAPSLIVLHSVIFAGEKPNAMVLLSLAGATFGCYLVVGAYNLDLLKMNLAGVVSGLLSAVTFAWYSVHGEYGMRRYTPWTVLFYALLFAALVWNVIHSPLEAFSQKYSMVEWGWIFYIAILGTLLPFGLYLEGINLIRSTRASITAILEPITAGIVSYIFLDERMESLQIVGGVLVIAAIIVLQINQEQDDKAPGILRASCQEKTEIK